MVRRRIKALRENPVPGWVNITVALLLAGAIACWSIAYWLGPMPQRATPTPQPPVRTQPLPPAVPLEAPQLPPYSSAQASPSLAPVVSPTQPVPGMAEPVPAPTEYAPKPMAAAKPQAWPSLPAPPILPAPENPAWKAAATQLPAPVLGPKLVLILDDMGGNPELTQQALSLVPAATTLAFLPTVPGARQWAEAARARGHELLVHLPMEPLHEGTTAPSAGPTALRVGLTEAELASHLATNLQPLAGLVVGINNHMGSHFTAWPDGMRWLLINLQAQGLMFVDSKTAAPTATRQARLDLTLPVLSRDVFLDHVPTPQAVRREWQRAIQLARSRGRAIVIGHPLPATLQVLAEELPNLATTGVTLVPLTHLLPRT